MSKIFDNVLKNQSPALFFLKLGLFLTTFTLIVALCMLPIEPDSLHTYLHFRTIQQLIATAIAIFLQSIIGAWIIHVTLMKSE